MTAWTTISDSVARKSSATGTENLPVPSGTSSEASPNAPGTSYNLVATDIDAIPTTEVNSKNPPTLSGHPGEASKNGIETSGTPRWFRDWHRTQFVPLQQTLNSGDIRASPPRPVNDGVLSLDQKVARTGRSIDSIMARFDAAKSQVLAHPQAATACHSASTKESSGLQEGDHGGESPGRGKPSTEDPWRETLRRRDQQRQWVLSSGAVKPREGDAAVSDPNEYYGRRRYALNVSRNVQTIGRRRSLWEDR
ncbi:hypothetical protein DFH06DRAFT_1176760 [Mycena polygramma]|nr:hypothetical protein DFH06DRAFT_1176760 [Mycena polygramma]